MLATFMEVLDTSVANVALPHIAGSLSATSHEATWVLTSYLVSNAIILPATAWFGGFFGRKLFLIICIALFTVSSILCGLAPTLGLLIIARILQGIGGGALQPISQAVLLESFPHEKRGVAMSIFALGIVVAPIVGPTVGGWITDNFSWRWIFLINFPIGIAAVLMAGAFIEDPPYIQKNRSAGIDYVGFLLMAVWLGVLQVVLDKGEEADWFGTAWVRWAALLAAVSFVSFIIWELRVKNPVVNLRIVKNRNFATGMVVITVIGAVLYGTTALLPLFLQNLMGYSALVSGLVVSPRGLGAFLTAAVIGRLIGKIDARVFVGCGLVILGLTCFQLGDLNLEIGLRNMIWPIVGTGIGVSSVFIPLTTLSVGRLHREDIGNATGLYNLMRNVGGGIGIAVITTMLSRLSQVHQSVLAAHLTPYDPVYRQWMERFHAAGAGGQAAYAMMYRILGRQANLLAYVDNFRAVGIVCLFCTVSVFFFQKVSAPKGAAAMAAH